MIKAAINKESYLIALLILVLLSFSFSGCATKSSRKNTADLRLGDSKELVAEFWGEPDVIKPSADTQSGRELWVYECLQFFDCSDSSCFFVTPCYYVYFKNNSIVSIYDAVLW